MKAEKCVFWSQRNVILAHALHKGQRKSKEGCLAECWWSVGGVDVLSPTDTKFMELFSPLECDVLFSRRFCGPPGFTEGSSFRKIAFDSMTQASSQETLENPALVSREEEDESWEPLVRGNWRREQWALCPLVSTFRALGHGKNLLPGEIAMVTQQLW